MEKTIFEKIVAGDIPSYRVYEDSDIYAFLDINPHNPGHTLVIPKKPYKNIYELPEDICGKLFSKVKRISIAVKKAVNADGIKIVMNNDSAAGQIVFHSHVHIIPRFENDNWPKNFKYSEGEAEEVMNKIIDQLSI